VLDDLIQRSLRRREFLIVDSAVGLETAIAAGMPVQRCTAQSRIACPLGDDTQGPWPEMNCPAEAGQSRTMSMRRVRPREVEALRKTMAIQGRLATCPQNFIEPAEQRPHVAARCHDFRALHGTKPAGALLRYISDLDRRSPSSNLGGNLATEYAALASPMRGLAFFRPIRGGDGSGWRGRP
jgi:hypothetical protein